MYYLIYYLIDNAVCVKKTQIFVSDPGENYIIRFYFWWIDIKKNHRTLLKKINCYVWHGSFYLWVFVYIYWKWLKCFFPHFDTLHMI